MGKNITKYERVRSSALLLTVVRAGSAVRNPVAWVGVYLFAAQDSWFIPRHPGWTETLGVVRWTSGWIILFGVLVGWALFGAPRRRRDVEEAAPGSAPAQEPVPTGH